MITIFVHDYATDQTRYVAVANCDNITGAWDSIIELAKRSGDVITTGFCSKPESATSPVDGSAASSSDGSSTTTGQTGMIFSIGATDATDATDASGSPISHTPVSRLPPVAPGAPKPARTRRFFE